MLHSPKKFILYILNLVWLPASFMQTSEIVWYIDNLVETKDNSRYLEQDEAENQHHHNTGQVQLSALDGGSVHSSTTVYQYPIQKQDLIQYRIKIS